MHYRIQISLSRGGQVSMHYNGLRQRRRFILKDYEVQEELDLVQRGAGLENHYRCCLWAEEAS